MNDKFVILDRDGVINHDSNNYIKSPDEWTPIPGSLEAISRFNKKGFIVVVATNQSGISRGYFDVVTLTEIHNKMIKELSYYSGRINSIFFCPCLNEKNCHCRKPKPGMIFEIKKRYKIYTNNIFYIGDSFTDFQAAKAAKINFALVKTGNGLKTIKKNKLDSDIVIADNLFEATKVIINNYDNS